ncbi:BlaI/MecI/CopY family transcriptional regulator [Candidatus Woesearchaeota archaeon]|nr:BlaI/MecI/CopY family transcriptional regulator [Candidatus Woesearchaeota archaeon]
MKELKLKEVLSPLEQEILKVVWPNKSLKVREIYEQLKKSKKKVALSSVAVLLDRLFQKNIVGRKVETGRGGIRYIYFPLKDKKGFDRTIIVKVVDNLIKKFGDNALTYFDERFSKK